MDSMMPLSCPSGTVASTTSPTTARTCEPFNREAACSHRTSLPVLHAHERIPAIQLHNLTLLQASSFCFSAIRLRAQGHEQQLRRFHEREHPLPYPIEDCHHGQSDDNRDGTRNEPVELELVLMVRSRLYDGNHLGVKIAHSVVIGTHEMKRPAHLKGCARGAVLSVRVDLRGVSLDVSPTASRLLRAPQA